MIVHYAYFKWKPTLTPAELERIRTDFAALKDAIPQIRGFRWVYNNSTEGLDRGFREGIRAEFDTIEARERYLAHPAHVAFAKGTIIPALEDGLNSVMVFDYAE